MGVLVILKDMFLKIVVGAGKDKDKDMKQEWCWNCEYLDEYIEYNPEEDDNSRCSCLKRNKDVKCIDMLNRCGYWRRKQDE